MPKAKASTRASKKQANARKNAAHNDSRSSSSDKHCGYKECFPFSPIAPCTPPVVCPIAIPTVPTCQYWPLEGPCCNIPGNGGCPRDCPPISPCPPGYYCAPIDPINPIIPPYGGCCGQNNNCPEQPVVDCRCVPYLCVECGFVKVELTVSALPTTFSNFGDQIVFTYTVTNTGTAPLCFPYQIWDSRLGTEHIGPSLLFPNQSSTSTTRTYTITQSDIAEGIANGFITSTAAVYVRVPSSCAKPSPCCNGTPCAGGNCGTGNCGGCKDSSSCSSSDSSSSRDFEGDIWVYSDTVTTTLQYVAIPPP